MGLSGLKHVSVRVPWHDNGWNGRVCLDPKGNAACLAVRLNAKYRDDDDEQLHRDMAFTEMAKVPPCLAERGAFLSPREHLHRAVLQYSLNKHGPHAHILPATVRIPAFGGTFTPFRWMLKEHAWNIASNRGIEASEAVEPLEGEVPDFVANGSWVQNAENQRSLLDSFADDLAVDDSLVFFYAPQTPLSDSAGRQIVAVAKVTSIGRVDDYPYEGGRAGARLRSIVWERPFQHSLRPDPNLEGAWVGGVVLPYQAILSLAKTKNLDLERFVAEVPVDGMDQFRYASEHVAHGTAISALLSVRMSLEQTKTVMEGPWDRYIEWIDGELSSLWKMQGLAPGLGSALSLIGGKFKGTLFAQALAAELEDDVDPWPIIEQIFAGEREPPVGAPTIKPMQIRRFADTKTNDLQRYAFLQLLSRFELTRDQARQIDDDTSDPTPFLENPYLLYELTRRSPTPIGLTIIDRTLYPDRADAKRAPFPKTMKVDLDDTEDALRLRAMLVVNAGRIPGQRGGVKAGHC